MLIPVEDARFCSPVRWPLLRILNTKCRTCSINHSRYFLLLALVAQSDIYLILSSPFSATSPCFLVPSPLTVTPLCKMAQTVKARWPRTSRERRCTAVDPTEQVYSRGTCISQKIVFCVSRLLRRSGKPGCKCPFSWVISLTYAWCCVAQIKVRQKREGLNRCARYYPRIHLPTSTLVERFAVCVYPFHCVLVPDLDFWSKLFQENYFDGSFAMTACPVWKLISVRFQIEFIYNAVQLIFTWTSLANFYLAFFFVSGAVFIMVVSQNGTSSWFLRQQPRQMVTMPSVSWLQVLDKMSLKSSSSFTSLLYSWSWSVPWAIVLRLVSYFAAILLISSIPGVGLEMDICCRYNSLWIVQHCYALLCSVHCL